MENNPLSTRLNDLWKVFFISSSCSFVPGNAAPAQTPWSVEQFMQHSTLQRRKGDTTAPRLAELTPWTFHSMNLPQCAPSPDKVIPHSNSNATSYTLFFDYSQFLTLSDVARTKRDNNLLLLLKLFIIIIYI